MAPVTDGEADLRSRVARLSVEQKVRLLTGADFWSLYPEPAVGLRRVVLSDGPAGVRGHTWDERDTSANVPSPTALAASWDCERVEAIGRLLAHEARRKGVDVLLAPTVNLHRTPFGGRHFECFSEDPLLTARIGVAYVRGLQNSGVGATVKHFVGNDSETMRMTVDVRIDERTLRELYLAPFEAIVREAGAWSVMAAYNGVNGSTMTESPLLRDILHDEWDYDGLVMSDWTAARSTEPAARAALDLAMPGPANRFGPWGDALLAAVQAGRVDEALIDDKVLRILRLAARVGALTDGPAPASGAAVDIPRELRAAAAGSFVLARNDGLLPLNRSALGRVAVIGPNAEVARTLGGGSATVFPPYTVSPLDGLRAAGLAVAFAPGVLGHLRTSAARAPWLLRPDGSGPGAEVRFFSPTGELVGSERRDGAVFRWMNGFDSVGATESIARLEVSCVIRATEAGVYQLGVSGLGHFRLLVDGAVVFDETLTRRPARGYHRYRRPARTRSRSPPSHALTPGRTSDASPVRTSRIRRHHCRPDPLRASARVTSWSRASPIQPVRRLLGTCLKAPLPGSRRREEPGVSASPGGHGLLRWRWRPSSCFCATYGCRAPSRMALTAPTKRCRRGTCCTATGCCVAGPSGTCRTTPPSCPSTYS